MTEGPPSLWVNKPEAAKAWSRARQLSAGQGRADSLEERIDHGVWGGCSERERRRILKRRRDELGTLVDAPS